MSAPDLVLLAAVAKNGVIGINNRLPWHLPEDLKHFKALTTGHAVILGRKTWDSLPEKFRPLPQRQNIVLTRDAGFVAQGAQVANSLDAALGLVTGGTAFVIGGAEIYRLTLPRAQRLELTELDDAFEGDTFFPEIERSAWRELERTRQTSASGIAFSFASYGRAR
jgi:dihydrofolate reductase